jgi:Xaa-Pro aminopeptidase
MFQERIKTFVNALNGKPCLLEETYDLYYFSGIQMSSGILLLGEKTRALFVDGRYFEKAKGQNYVEVFPIESLKEHLNKLSVLLFDSAKTSVEQLLTRQKEYPKLSFVGHPHLTKKQRVIKDTEEQKKMRAAAALAKKGFLFACEGIAEGVKEKDIAWRFEKYCKEHGATKMSFETIVAFGENSAFPHHRASSRVFKKDETVLIDAGCVVDGYASDMTRTIAGTSPDMQKLDRVVSDAQSAALAKCKAGVQIKELDLAAREVMKKEGLEHFFVHSLGHGIGLETHEYPRLKYNSPDADVVLETGMAVTIEPGLYIPGLGGVRREDTVFITKSGIENLYGDLP